MTFLAAFEGEGIGNTVRAILGAIATPAVWSQYSLRGSKGGKLSFDKLIIYDVVIDAVLERQPETQRRAINDKLLLALKHMPKKKGGPLYRVRFYFLLVFLCFTNF